MAMQSLLDAALPLSQVLWRGETEGKDFSTPERRAGLEHNLREIVGPHHRRQDRRLLPARFRSESVRQFQETAGPDGSRPRRASAALSARPGPFRGPFRPQPGTAEAVSPAVKASLLARAGRSGAVQVKETELAVLLLEDPVLAARHGELLAQLHFSDPSLDRLRHELLNLAASGSSLEKTPVLSHFTRLGMAEMLARLGAARPASDEPSQPDALSEHDTEARFLRAALDLRKLAEEPERARALARFAAEGSEEAWREASRFLGPANE